MDKRKGFGLGKGIDALMDTSQIETAGATSINEIELSQIVRNTEQPREHFDAEQLEELAASIREFGVISPITVTEQADGTYMIIAGERRFRASQMAGLRTIPAYIRKADAEQLAEMALIENIQRADLNAIEIALAYHNLLNKFDLTQERLADRLGVKRTTIANYVRLLNLPAVIQEGVEQGAIEMGHARAILALPEPTAQIELYKRVVSEGLSVRQVEQLAKEGKPTPKKPRIKNQVLQLAELKELNDNLKQFFGTKVKMTCDKQGKGQITIPFKNDEELRHIMEQLDLVSKR